MQEEQLKVLEIKNNKMASTITPANLTVTISETINLNNQPVNSENQLVISDINEFDKRIMQLPINSEVTIVAFASALAAGTFVRGDMKYFRITNKDNTNYARVRVKKNGADTFDVRIDAGKSFMMGNGKIHAAANGASFVSFEDIDSISGQAYDAPVDIEYVVASI